MNQYFIPILLGTARQGRQSEKVAKYILEQVKKAEIGTELIDVREFTTQDTIPSWIENMRANHWAEVVKKADALIIVSPEYNHSFPGELKIALDTLFQEYKNKPVAVCGVSKGGLGGARMVENLLPVLAAFQMFYINSPVYFSKVEELFDEQGTILDDSYDKKVERMLTEIRSVLNNEK